MTDEDVSIIDPEIKSGEILNIKDILLKLSVMKSTHGEGKMYASIIASVNFENAFPISLSALDYTQNATDVDYMVATADFAYQIYEIKTL